MLDDLTMLNVLDPSILNVLDDVTSVKPIR